MSTWNYRLVKLPNPLAGSGFYYEVREVFYDSKDRATAMTNAGVSFGGETPAEAVKALEMALKDARERPVFEPPEKWL